MSAKFTENLTLKPNTLVFYIDDTGDEQLGNPQYPVFGFGGIAVTNERYATLLSVMDHGELGRFGTIVTDNAVITPTLKNPEGSVKIACDLLSKRLGSVAQGMMSLGAACLERWSRSLSTRRG